MCLHQPRAQKTPLGRLLLALTVIGAAACAQATLFGPTGTTQDRYGSRVCGIGDVTGDGREDWAVSVPYDDVDQKLDCGSIHIIDGANSQTVFVLPGLLDGDMLGTSLACAGDVNGDGVNDIIGGAPSGDNPITNVDRGMALVFSGADGSILLTFYGGSSNGYFGESVAGVGDVNDDGFDDVLVGDPSDNTGGPSWGSVTVFSGATGDVLRQWFGSGTYSNFGVAAASAGDVNLDGKQDVIVGSPGTDFNGGYSGTVYVYSGANGALLYSFNGIGSGDGLGLAVASAGDVNGDGLDDFLLGSTTRYGRGAVDVRSGFGGTLIAELSEGALVSRFGAAIASAGDVDLDGLDEVIVGAFADGPASTGSYWVFHPTTGQLIHSEAGGPNDASGFAVGAVASPLGDGRSAVLVGEIGFNTAGRVRCIAFGPVPMAGVVSLPASCSASAGLSLSLSGLPKLAAALTITIAGGQPGSTGFLFLDAGSPAPTPGILGCTLHVDPASAFTLSTFSFSVFGASAIPVVVPGIEAAGSDWTLQAVGNRPSGFLSLSNGLLTTVGF